ncbi:dihydrolipoyl dehydrogenase [Halogeometricum sp. S1BR25-6]|uniref:Dihydrolipoyl dehydrogenase n=1 Tax=Halogeometricum salsisoli TaxID=2950536 RepID=A0ABU2GIP3_9EURY|nr:dihydrolipoyl dehydrogenase [Halogeometricum sp. S1BR25-6]MDS0300701.1 dihydrolipoyl dehydrogenase [Halogeometricum sp. S1BR25-6]
MSDQQIPNETELLVVGAGPGGYVAAIRAGQLGLDVILVEKEAVGGTCLNYGCIPSKALISAADTAHDAAGAENRGVRADPEVHLEDTVEWKDGVVDRLTGGVEQLCEAAGATVVEGVAEFVDGTTATVRTDDGEAELSFEYAVVATGSRPVELPGFAFDDDPILDSRGALALEEAPDSLLVVGGGYIGMELAGVYAKVGTDVTVVEMLDEVLPGYGEEASELVRERAAESGVDFQFGEQADEWTEADDGDGVRVTTVTEDGEESEYDADRVLVVVGREPVADTANLDAIGVETNEDGFVETDGRGRTAVDNVFAVGDVAGEPMVAHKGMREGETVAEVIAGEPAALDYQAVPTVVFTDPEIATVGMTESDAEEAGYDTVVGEMPLRANGRALTLDEEEGFVRVVADDDEGYLLGAQIVAPEASELIAEFGLALELGATLDDVSATIHTHPTLSEAAKEAAANASGRAIHTQND